MAIIQNPIPIPEPINEVDSLWRTTQALKEAVEVLQGIRGAREAALSVDVDNAINLLQQEIDNITAGGGGVTDHTLLTNIGTNTHTQIDTHLALVNEHINWAITGGQVVHPDRLLNVNDQNGVDRPIGLDVIPIREQDTSVTLSNFYRSHIYHKNAGVAATYTCPLNDNNIPRGAWWMVRNFDTENLTIARAGDVSLYFMDGNGVPVSADFDVEPGGMVTIYKYQGDEYWAWGTKDGGGTYPTHTGEVTGDVNLSLNVTAITNQTELITTSIAADDEVVISDTDGGTLARADVSVITDAGYF